MSIPYPKENALLIFQKNMILGKAKTRIAATVGDKRALEIYAILIRFTHKVVKDVDAKKIIYFSDYIEEVSSYGKDYSLMVQNGENLGRRMSNAFEEVFKQGFKKVIVIGTDCGELKPEIIQKAYDLLEFSDTVIGPAEDGGYYLIGMKKANPTIFQRIDWSTEKVFTQTIQRIKNTGLTNDLLPTLVDADTYEDWLGQKEKVESLLK